MSFTESFLGKMMSENGEPSSKRWLAATIGAALTWCIIYSTLKASNAGERLSIIIATMSFVAVLIGVATFPQIIALIKGTPPPKEEENKEPKQ
jgi:hypothetical protein